MVRLKENRDVQNLTLLQEKKLKQHLQISNTLCEDIVKNHFTSVLDALIFHKFLRDNTL